MRRMMVVALAAVWTLVAATAAHAVFHLNLIDEIASGVGGDSTVQYVEVRVLGFQNIVGDTRLTAFNCDGTSSQVLLVVPGDVANYGTGVRLVMATTNFAAAAGITPDFTWDPTMSGNIDPTCGMVCWGAPGFAPPDPMTWSASDQNQYVDCVGYGGYTGTRKTSTHNMTPTSGTPTALGPGDGQTLSLTRGSTAGNNTADFALACTSPTNNAGMTGSFGPCTPPSTTTSTTIAGATTTTTTTTLPALPLTPLAGGGSKKTDCYGQWKIAGGTGKATVRCKNGDPCDSEDHEDDCHIAAQLCFGAAAGKCAAATVTQFAAPGLEKDDFDRENLDTITEAVAALGGQAGGSHSVSFSTAPAEGACTEPFLLEVPLKMKRGKFKKGMRTIKTAITAGGKVDKDTLKLICTP